jgi:exopolysaccharide biosynthesis predicted pyruvyltransferase EpsI
MGVRALKKAPLQIPSMQKIINALSVISFLLVVAISGGGVFGYLWITNEENQEKLKKEVIGNLTGSLPIPKTLTGPAIPTAPIPKF